MKDYCIEICANSAQSALLAQEGGAARVELCAGMPEGGTTPSYGEIAVARRLLHIRLHVIVRPRGGDFLYSSLEQAVMVEDIRMARRLGADGVVVGCLTPDGDVDIPLMRRLMDEAEGMAVTFHRAFDMVRHPEQALEDIVGLGCQRILTSGGKASALEGTERLRMLNRQADGRIIVMPGCGINPQNIRRIADETGCHEFHFSGRTRHESPMRYRNTAVSMGGTVCIDEYGLELTDPERVRMAVDALCQPSGCNERCR